MSENKIQYGHQLEDINPAFQKQDLFREVGSGWTPLLDKLLDDLFAAGWDGRVLQVKEKFGGLRFYIGGEFTDEIYELIRLAENKSFKICEDCGEPGERRGDGWIRTLCVSCNEKFLEGRKHIKWN